MNIFQKSTSLCKLCLRRYESTIQTHKIALLEKDIIQPEPALQKSSTKKKTSRSKKITNSGPVEPKISSAAKKSHAQRLSIFFHNNPHLAAVKSLIPEKYLALKRVTPPDNLYLIDENVAKTATSYILPHIQNIDTLVSETNAGLGLITSQLLENNVKCVRIYESCPDFKVYLKDAFLNYSGHVELFAKDIFLLHRYEFIDKHDHGNRVEQLLQGIPKKSWIDDPTLTIIGPLPNMNFIRFLFKCLVLQHAIVTSGRIQLFVFMRPRDYIVLTAGPHLNLHTYQRWSVLFNLFFDVELLDKFPREVFLPWQSPKSAQTGRFPGHVDKELMYFVRICFKKDLPVTIENLLPLHAFVVQFFGKGTNRIIPVLERWVPNSGLDMLFPKVQHPEYFTDMNIFTKFGELTPGQILSVFKEMITSSGYEKSHFMSIIESHLVKTETTETSVDEHLEKNIENIVETIECKNE